MSDAETSGTSALNKSDYQLAKPLNSDIVCQTNCSLPKSQSIEVRLSDGSVGLRFTSKRMQQISDIETSTS